MVEKYEKRVLISVITIFVIIQVFMVTFIEVEQFSDSRLYLEKAYKVFKECKLYPTESNLNDVYIVTPGWVNLIALLLNAFGSIKSILYFNIILNVIILGELYYIAKRFFGLQLAIISLFLFVLLLSNYGIVLFLLTELIFVALLLGSFCLFIQNNLKYYILSGILVGLANWVRPFALAIIVILFLSLLILRLPIRRMIPWILGLLFSIILIGSINYLNCGQFIYSPTTVGVNMIIGANPLADGSWDETCLEVGEIGYIPNASSLNVKEKEAIWKTRAIEWAVNNPIEWIKLIPKKIFYMYSCEITLLHHFRSEPRSGSYVNDFKGIIRHFPKLNSFEWLLILDNIVYLFILFMALLSVYFVVKNIFYPGYITLLFILLLTAPTVLAYGADRYHYPMIPPMILLASYSIENLCIIFFKKKTQVVKEIKKD